MYISLLIISVCVSQEWVVDGSWRVMVWGPHTGLDINSKTRVS